MGTAVMRPVADRAKQSFVLFDTAERQSAQMSKNYKRRLNPRSGTGPLGLQYCCTHTATVGVKGLAI